MVAIMTRLVADLRLGSNFDDFLFATVVVDRNGTEMTVLSALARLEIDPWQTASEIARLPEDTAARRLVALLAPLPDVPSDAPAALAIATRLVAHLSARPRLRSQPIELPRPGAPSAHKSWKMSLAGAVVAMIVVLLGLQLVAAVHRWTTGVETASRAPEAIVSGAAVTISKSNASDGAKR